MAEIRINKGFMPFSRTWLPNISNILATVSDSIEANFDRDAMSRIFALRRRATLALMKEIGPECLRSGRWVVSREKLHDWIEGQSKEAELELVRKRRFTQAIVEADASLPRRPSILLAPRKLSAKQRDVYAANLPDGVVLEPGSPNRLTVEFLTIEELAERLLAAGIALNNRFKFYRDMLEPDNGAARDSDEAERWDAEHFRKWKPDRGDDQ